MRILLITTSYPESADGREAAGSFVADFAEELAAHAEVAVVAPGAQAQVNREGAVSVHRFASPLQPLSLLEPSNPAHWLAIFRTLQAGRAVSEQAAEVLNPDHIFALWALPSGYWARSVAGARNISFSTWALGSDIWGLGRVPVVRSVLAKVLAEGSVRFADGYELANDVERISGRDCRFLPSVRRLPAIELERVATQPPYRLAFLGRWHPNKGIDLLLEAMSQLGDEDWPRIEEIRIFGGGPLESEVKSATQALASQGRPITMGGYLDSQEAAALYAWTDYLVLPSRIESIPVLFSDAVQARCPLIATPVGDLPRLMREHEVGILAPEATASGVLAGLHEALERSPSQFTDSLDQAAKAFSTSTAVEDFLGAVGPV